MQFGRHAGWQAEKHGDDGGSGSNGGGGGSGSSGDNEWAWAHAWHAI